MVFDGLALAVRATLRFPPYVRPTLLLLLLVATAWLVVSYGPVVVRIVLRLLAVCSAGVVVVGILLPEFMVTSALRNRGRKPGVATVTVDAAADRVLDVAVGVYDAAGEMSRMSQRFPWKWLAVAGVAFGSLYWFWAGGNNDLGVGVPSWVQAVWLSWYDIEYWAAMRLG